MNGTIPTVATVAIFKFAFKRSWKTSLILGAVVFAVAQIPSLTWKRKDEKLGFPGGSLTNADGLPPGAMSLN